jgi:hypothetical protein
MEVPSSDHVGLSFTLSREQTEKFVAWRDDETIHRRCAQTESGTAIGGALTFKFTPTTIGTVVTVSCCVCNTEIDLSEYDSW